MNSHARSKRTLADYTEGILAGNRVVLGQAITLIESTRPDDQALSAQLLSAIGPNTGGAIRVGITGVPGVGKSTFIEALGLSLAEQQKKIAVLTVDPSSPLTRGSILGDKTRMEELSKHPNGFIRPSASGNALGGVAHKTREAMLLCEAAGFDVIIIETVGVGQSEVAVKNMVDFFLLLMLAGAGDELQGIKKGIMEMADAIVITKAEGDNFSRAQEARADYQHALHLFPPPASGWTPRVLTSSALTGEGIEATWKLIEEHHHQTTTSGHLDLNRKHQNVAWFQEYFKDVLQADLHRYAAMKTLRQRLEKDVETRHLSAQDAARQLLDAYHQAIRGSKS
ncbi:methylmalonyl Co-A mutase-associated GTPase MeaB [Chryseolinea lacunae]|uniref:Methylmalonyl Co-A mutase-associated GTPase MeaB n=1 Tax=Chryseolinea lacunae TaxID=2801331 RepID=A0ABS1KSB8_9BACT|nr:methylmalonyl Co-A mutase-associated GTPase MeaB [Chryseolinea lacunae]MBL0742360.1 methylmalonyl Co-A mutase-associated GTPase MeaB [Chryseolinea lacunae]